MSFANLRSEERIGLAIAAAAHIALFAALAMKPPGGAIVVPPERMTVTLSDDVGLTSTAPEAAAPQPDIAPVLAEQSAEEVPPPEPVAVARVEPEPVRPVARATSAPVPKPVARPIAKPAASTPPPRAQPAKPAGGSRLGSDFLKGVANAPATGTSRSPAAVTIGPAVRSSLSGAISRQLKPKWVAPQGADAELLVTVVRFRLARDGSLTGSPEVVRQSGETPANAAQMKRHAEQAIRAVRLAAPFDLPEEYYSGWQVVTSTFDRRLSQ